MLFTKPSFHLVGDNLGAGGATAVASHDGAALYTDHAVLTVHHALQHGEALGAEALDGGLHLYLVVVVYLRPEVHVVVHHHHGEVALGRRQAMPREEGILAQVEVLHDDGIIHVTHLVHIVESYLNRCCMHGLLFFQ